MSSRLPLMRIWPFSGGHRDAALPDHKPIPLKKPYLFSLFLITVNLLAALEYARQKLPIAHNPGDIPKFEGLTPPITYEPTTAGVSKRSLAPSWGFKNNTGVAGNVSTSLNVSSSSTNASLPYSIPLIGVNLVQTSQRVVDPSQFATYDGGIMGPTMFASYRCLWEPGPVGKPPLNPYDRMNTETNFWDCTACFETSSRAWYSDDPNDCKIQFLAYSLDGHVVPWNENTWTKNGWSYMPISGACGIPSRCAARCPPPCVYTDDGEQPDEEKAVTTVLRMIEETTTTLTFPGTRTIVSKVTTGTDGRATTAVQTTTIGGGIATITSDKTILVTATKPANGELWIQVGSTTVDGRAAETVVITLTDSNGVPTATLTEHFQTLTDSNGRPTATQTDFLMALTDSNGLPTATITEILDPTTAPTRGNGLNTVVDGQGNPTGTLAIQLETLVDNNGVPTATVTGYINPSATVTGVPRPPSTGAREDVYLITPQNYFVAAFLPVLIASALAIFIQVVDTNLKLMVPFYMLTRKDGALARDSLGLNLGGITGPLTSVRLLYRFHQPLALLSDLLLLLSSLIVSISSDTVGIKLYGKCTTVSFKGCMMSLAVFDGTSRVTEVLLVAMAVVILLIAVFLHRSRCGTIVTPWSVAAIASLLHDSETRKLLQSITATEGKNSHIATSELVNALQGKVFSIGHHGEDHEKLEYGVYIKSEADEGTPSPQRGCRIGDVPKCVASDAWRRVGFLAMLVGVLILILYYETTYSNTPFERFMDMQDFGVHFLFSGLGVLISLFWDSVFSEMAMVEPYANLSRSGSSSRSIISTAPATSVFTGMVRSLRRRDHFGVAVAFTWIVSKFTPLLLSNIPMRITQTWNAHLVCAWMTVTALSIMIIVLGLSFFVKRPHMPVTPNTVVGRMYYVCDSAMLDNFPEAAVTNQEIWRNEVDRTTAKYAFGEMVGISGRLRIGVHNSDKLQGV